jgi:hypothetical protein
MAGCARSTMDRRRHEQRARRRAHRSLASGHSSAQKLTGGGATERGGRGELGGWLIEARAAVWWPGDGGVEPKAVALGGSGARAQEEEKRGACEVRSDPGLVLTFYRGRGGSGWKCR